MINFHKIKYRLTSSKLVNDSFWAIFGNIIGKGLSLLTAILIARILGKEVYGEYGIMIGTIGAILIFSNFGLTYTTTKYIAEHFKTKPELILYIIKTCQKLTFIFSGIATIILFFSAEYVAIYLLKSPKLTIPLRLIAISIFIGSYCRTQTGILAGFGKYKDLAKINTFIGIGTFLSGVLLTYLYGLMGACLAFIFMHSLNFLCNTYFIRRYTKSIKSMTEERISIKQILNFSIPVALQEALYSIITYSTGLLLVQLSNYGEVGLHSAAIYWSAIILFIPGILRNVILTHLSANLDDDNKRQRILRVILIFNFSVTFVLSLIVYFSSNYIASSYGNNFAGLKDVINISVFTTIFISMSNVYAQAYMSENKNWLMLSLRIIRDGSIFLIAYFLIKGNDGAEGALLLAKSSLWSNILFLILMSLVYEFIKSKKT